MAHDPVLASSPLCEGAGLQPPDAAAIRLALRRAARASQAPWLHGEVASRMGAKLSLIRTPPARVLDWGAWWGGGSAVLRQAYPQARRTAVEATAALVDRHASRGVGVAGWAQRMASVWARQPSAALLEQDVPDASADLLWSNMALHTVADPAALLARWRDALSVGGLLMFSCLGPDTAVELQALYRRLGWPPPRHDLQDMHDIGDQLVHAGFADPVMDMERLRLTWRDAPTLLAEVHSWGGNAHPLRHAGLRTPRWRAALLDEMASLRRPDGTLALTVEIIYGHAVRAEPRVRMAPEATVSLDEMRSMAKARRSQAQRT